mmetsp:Transcript_3016/g.8936  ORF Transcript_3016/g.8936 Transcript_3016/m.8936 type:complete len:204 (+) Transcript_3016:1197-1808(+)
MHARERHDCAAHHSHFQEGLRIHVPRDAELDHRQAARRDRRDEVPDLRQRQKHDGVHVSPQVQPTGHLVRTPQPREVARRPADHEAVRALEETCERHNAGLFAVLTLLVNAKLVHEDEPHPELETRADVLPEQKHQEKHGRAQDSAPDAVRELCSSADSHHSFHTVRQDVHGLQLQHYHEQGGGMAGQHGRHPVVGKPERKGL